MTCTCVHAQCKEWLALAYCYTLIREPLVELKCHFHPSQTFPEIIPFIEVCVKMMEQVYNVPVDITTPTTADDRGQPTQVHVMTL